MTIRQVLQQLLDSYDDDDCSPAVSTDSKLMESSLPGK